MNHGCALRARALAILALSAATLLLGSSSAAAQPVLMPTLTKAIKTQLNLRRQAVVAPASRKLDLPAPPCPESGILPPIPGAPVQLSNCGLPELPATTLPYLGNMAYWGGHVQVRPREYVVYWGWGEPGAFPKRSCKARRIREGRISARLACDPDGAGRYMADFVRQMGGTSWAGISTQYFQTDAAGHKRHISNPRDQLAGLWVDDHNSITGLPKTNSTNPAGPSNTYWNLAKEAQRAVAHFRIRDLADANIIIAQPPAYSDPNAINSGYCAFHDYTLTRSPGNSYYAGVGQHISYTNLPYQLSINSGSQNDCGEHYVNGGPRGKLDGFSIVLGHEIEETVTDPGAEDIVGNINTRSERYYGGWYDPFDANENGDKCAWVGEPLNASLGLPNLPGEPRVVPLPGALGNIRGNRGASFAVQSNWSNAAAAGVGYCGGVNDLKTPAG